VGEARKETIVAVSAYPRPAAKEKGGAKTPKHPSIRFHSLGDEWGIEGPLDEVEIGVPVQVPTKAGKVQTVIPLELVDSGEPEWADCEVGAWRVGRPGRWVRADENGEQRWLVSVAPEMLDDTGVAPVLRKDGEVRFVEVVEPAVSEPDEWGCCLFAPTKGAAD